MKGMMFTVIWSLGLALPAHAQAGSSLLAQMRDAIAPCWMPDTDAPAVTLALRLDAQGMPVIDSILLLDPADPDAAGLRAAEAARRAILRCAGAGYPATHEELELRFDPADPQDIGGQLPTGIAPLADLSETDAALSASSALSPFHPSAHAVLRPQSMRFA
jgi:hypothetical protein